MKADFLSGGERALFSATHLVFTPFVCIFLPCSHREMADHVEAVAGKAVHVSKQTFGLLMELLQDNSTMEFVRNLTER